MKWLACNVVPVMLINLAVQHQANGVSVPSGYTPAKFCGYCGIIGNHFIIAKAAAVYAAYIYPWLTLGRQFINEEAAVA